MATATIRTLLTLDRWSDLIGLNKLHFNQIVSAAMPTPVCGEIWKSFDWQDSMKISREAVAQAIQDAERQIMGLTNYPLAPMWIADERVRTVRPAISEDINLWGLNPRGQRSAVQLSNGYYISGGIEAKTLIEAGAAVTYTDPDGDGYPELATITVNTTVSDPAEIAVYFPGESAAGEWEVRPLRSVTIGAGVATITCFRQQIPLPELWEAFAPEAIDGDDNANFLTTVDVYRHWNDPQQQVQLMWSPDGWEGCSLCGDAGCATCQAGVQWGCLLGKDYRNGIVHYQPAAWDPEEGAFTSQSLAVWRQPDRLRLWYYAGWQDTKLRYPTLQMDPYWERAVAYYSLCLLDREICGCTNLKELVRHWTQDLALNVSDPAGSNSYQTGTELLNNPFGTMRGALYAYQRVNSGEGRKLGKAVAL